MNQENLKKASILQIYEVRRNTKLFYKETA